MTALHSLDAIQAISIEANHPLIQAMSDRAKWNQSMEQAAATNLRDAVWMSAPADLAANIERLNTDATVPAPPADLLLASPGTGQQADLKAHAETLAQILGMRFVDEQQAQAIQQSGGQLGPQDFVFISQPITALTDVLDIKGLPLGPNNTHGFAGMLRQWEDLGTPGLGVIVLDGVLAAGPNVQELCVSLGQGPTRHDVPQLSWAHFVLSGTALSLDAAKQQLAPNLQDRVKWVDGTLPSEPSLSDKLAARRSSSAPDPLLPSSFSI